jgi:hypothetical protein
MATGTVTLHSWNDGAEDDEGDPPIGTNYNCRLDVRDDYNAAAKRSTIRTRSGGHGLRSSVVRPQRLGMDVGDDEEGGGRW